LIKTPQNIAILFNQQLAARSIPEQSRSHFCKWLRFYLDFCHKYGFISSEKSSLADFIDKLKEKNRTFTINNRLPRRFPSTMISYQPEIKDRKVRVTKSMEKTGLGQRYGRKS